jgi:hypothetical protein
MSKEREALKLALEALQNPWKAGPDGVADAITAIKEALAQPEQEQLMSDQINYGMSVTQGGKRIDPMSIYKEPEQEPVAWPKTPAEISDMIGSSYVWREHKISDVEPHESDKYCVTAHDLLEAFENWNEYTTPPQRKPLTDEEIAEFAERMEASDPTDSFWREFARAIEAAHGIKGEA